MMNKNVNSAAVQTNTPDVPFTPDPVFGKLIAPGDYGIINLQHSVEGDTLYYRLAGSGATERSWFPQNPRWINQIKRQPGSHFSREDHAWYIPFMRDDNPADFHEILVPILQMAQEPDIDPRTGHTKREDLELAARLHESKKPGVKMAHYPEYSVTAINPGEYGLITLEHVSQDKALSYRLRGSSHTEDGRFPNISSWNKVLGKREGAKFNKKEGFWEIPINTQDQANKVHNSLLPILSLSMQKIFNPSVWAKSPELFIPTFFLEDGIELICEGTYGQIRVQHDLSGKEKYRIRHMMYRLSGYKTPEGRFPPNPAWHRTLWDSNIGVYAGKSKQWRIILRNEKEAQRANDVLIPILKNAILDKLAHKIEAKNEGIRKRIQQRHDLTDEELDRLVAAQRAQ